MEANTILIVEDDAGLIELLSEKAEGCGYQTHSELSANKAIDWLKTNTPFLMMLDYSLPDMNGKELITELIGKGIKIPPFIVSTGKGDERIAVEMMKLGAKDYIIKDNHFLELIPLVISNVSAAIENEYKLKLAEEALIDSSQFYKQIIQSAQEGILVYDLDLKYVEWNPFMENLTGIPAGDVVGKHRSEVFPFLKADGVINNLGKALQGELIPEVDVFFEIPLTGKSGWVREKFSPLVDTADQITGVIVTVRNITERRLTEEKLKESEEKYRMLFNANKDSITIVRLDPAGNTSGFLEFNDAAAEMLDYTKEELLSMNIKEIEAPIAPEIMQARIEAVQTCGNVVFETLIKNKKGKDRIIENKVVVINYEGQPALMNISRDITEKIQIEKALKHSHDLMRYIIEHNRSAIAIHDRDLKYIYVSQRYLQDYKINGQDIIGKHHYEVFPDVPQKWREVHQRVLAGEVLSAEDDLYLRDDGTMDWTRWECRPWYESEGEIGGIVVYTEITTERKRTLEALKEKNEELLERNTFIQTILDHLPIGLALNTFHEGEATYMNQKFQEIYGWSSNEITSIASFFEKVFPDNEYRELIAKTIMNDICSGDPQRMHWENLYVTRKDGSKRVVNAVNIPMLEQNTMVSTVMDITALHQFQSDLIKAKEKAEESEFRLIEAQKTAHIGHWNWNFKNKQLTWSDEIFNIFGLSKESFELTAESFESFIHPDDLDDFKHKIGECLVSGGEVNIDHRIVRTNGEIRFVQERSKILRDGNNQPINVVGTVQDITALKLIEIDLVKAKERAEEKEYRLKLATASGKLGIYDWNLVDNSSIWDDRMFELYGITRDTFPNGIDAWTNGLHPEDKQRAIEECNAALNGKDYFNTSFRILRPNGQVLHLKSASTIIRNSDGKPLRMIGINRDITKSRLAAKQLTIAKERAEESDRLKSAFLANMSHEIRTPLNGILGFSELLNDPDFDLEQKKEFTQTIIENSNNLLVIINDIIDISMLEAGQITSRKERFAIHQLFVDLKNEFSAKVSEKGLQFQMKVPSDCADKIIENDYYRMRQVFNNLIGNALKFTNSGGIEIGFLPREGAVEFYVKDTGIGISPNFHEDIFERFRQVDETITRRYGGNGLGLAISKYLVEMLGGRIWVESQDGIGSTFYFTLPENGKGESN